MDRYVQTDYGIISEKDLPVLVPDSPWRCAAVWAFSFIIILTLAYIVMVMIAAPKCGEGREFNVKTRLDFVAIQLNNTTGRYIYVVGEDLQAVVVNSVYIPLRSGDFVDLGADHQIRNFAVKCGGPIKSVLVRDALGHKVLEIA